MYNWNKSLSIVQAKNIKQATKAQKDPTRKRKAGQRFISATISFMLSASSSPLTVAGGGPPLDFSPIKATAYHPHHDGTAYITPQNSPKIKRRSLSEGLARDHVVQSDLLEIVKEGLPTAKSMDPKKVVIVGAGIAGVCAARELRKAGHEVVILESSNRAGGRIYTVREPFSDGLWGEAGAMRIPPIHSLVHAYAHILNVPMSRFRNNTGKALYYFDEPNIPNKITHEDSKEEIEVLHNYWRETYKIDEKSLPILKKFKNTIEAVNKEIERIGYSEVVKKYDEMTFEKFLLSKDWKEDEILLFGLTSAEESYLPTGAIENIAEFVAKVWDDESEYPHPYKEGELIKGLREFEGGMDKFTEAFLNELKDGVPLNNQIHFGAKVTDIEVETAENSHIKIIYESNKCKKEVLCDYALMTVPLTALRNIEVTPSWSLEKQNALRQVRYAPSSKIFLQYSQQWWLDKNLTYQFPEEGGGAAFTSMPIRQIYLPSKSHSDIAGTERGVIIASYTWEQDAQIWASFEHNDAVSRAQEQVAKIFPESADYYEKGYAWHWHLDSNTGGGAFAYFLPGQWQNHFKAVVSPEPAQNPRVFFAGEHASPTHSWIQGALESALLAAKDLHETSQEIKT